MMCHDAVDLIAIRGLGESMTKALGELPRGILRLVWRRCQEDPAYGIEPVPTRTAASPGVSRSGSVVMVTNCTSSRIGVWLTIFWISAMRSAERRRPGSLYR